MDMNMKKLAILLLLLISSSVWGYDFPQIYNYPLTLGYTDLSGDQAYQYRTGYQNMYNPDRKLNLILFGYRKWKSF